MEFFHSPQIPDKNNNNEKKLINSREILTWKFCIKHSLKGSIIGFLLVLVPLSLKNRKLTGLKQATALSILFGSFRASNCLIEKFLNPLNQKNQSQTLPILKKFLYEQNIPISASLSTFLSLMIDDTLKNSVIVLWLLIRAIRYTLPFSVPYGDVIVMCLSATQILSTWIRCPWEHAPSYWKFLNKHGGDVGPGKAIQLDPLFETSPPISNGCSTIHPGMDCYTHAVKFWIAGLKRAFPVYLPIHLFGLIFSQKRSLTYFLENMIRSTVFLSTYCTSAWLGACIWLNYVKSGVTKKNIYCVLWIPGLAILFERPGRRKELAAYCLTHAFNTIWNYFKQRYGVKSRDWVSTFLLTLSLTVIFQYHQELPKFMTRHLFGIAELHSYLEKYKK